MLRGATIIHAKGGYQQEDRIILRIVFDKKQYVVSIQKNISLLNRLTHDLSFLQTL